MGLLWNRATLISLEGLAYKLQLIFILIRNYGIKILLQIVKVPFWNIIARQRFEHPRLEPIKAEILNNNKASSLAGLAAGQVVN